MASDGRGSGDDAGNAPRSRPSGPLVTVLLVLLLVLLAGGAFLWFTRPGESAVRTDVYAKALQAARSGVVDLTSLDYLLLDETSSGCAGSPPATWRRSRSPSWTPGGRRSPTCRPC